MDDGGVGGTDTIGAGSDDGTEGAGGSPPQAAFVNETMSSVPVPVSVKVRCSLSDQHDCVNCAPS